MTRYFYDPCYAVNSRDVVCFYVKDRKRTTILAQCRFAADAQKIVDALNAADQRG